jgi:predicted nucleotidyltransferase
MTYGLTEKELLQIKWLFENQPKVKQAVLYGSRAKGTYKPYSDVDIALIGGELLQKDVKELLSIINDTNFPYQVDLVLFHSLKNQDLIDHIQRVGVVIYSN